MQETPVQTDYDIHLSRIKKPAGSCIAQPTGLCYRNFLFDSYTKDLSGVGA